MCPNEMALSLCPLPFLFRVLLYGRRNPFILHFLGDVRIPSHHLSPTVVPSLCRNLWV